MELRTHPKMEWEGFSNWPPAWAGSYGAEDVFPGEEEGVLTGCRSPYLNRLARAILAQGKPREAEMLTRRMVLPPEWEAGSAEATVFSQNSISAPNSRSVRSHPPGQVGSHLRELEGTIWRGCPIARRSHVTG